MTKIEQIAREAQALSDHQLEAALEFIRSMKREPLFYSAPPEALASLERGLAEVGRGETLSLEEVDRRLSAAAKPVAK
jgi:hypothetical protein